MIGTQDNVVLVLDAKTGAVKSKREKHERPVTSVCVSPDGKTFYSASMDMTVRAWKN